MKNLPSKKNWAVIIGAGGVAALQAIKLDFFSFPIIEADNTVYDVRLILTYFFSITTVFAIFLGGSTILTTSNELKEMIGRLRDIKDKEVQEEKDQIKENGKK